jgi:NAD(P)-dependent dehydrogenase (short-subunit alcohol dehydrogenase family)
MKVQDKGFLVTGAGGGIGRELVLCLLSKGARVAGVDLAPQALEETVSLTGRCQDQFGGFVVNITDRASVEALPDQVIRRFGAVDGLINNAGIIQPFCRLKDLDYSTIERVVNVNLLGTLFCTKTFLPSCLSAPRHTLSMSPAWVGSCRFLARPCMVPRKRP